MFSIHGIGTAVYGERDYRPDGSCNNGVGYVCLDTDLSHFQPSDFNFQTRFDAVYDASSYYVHETSSPNLKQVLSVYSWIASLIALCFAANMFQEDFASVVGIPTLGTLIALPSALRRRAKRRNAREWERAKARAGRPAT
jgi:hypothetical protein